MKNPVIHNKLIRDNIPKVIEDSDKDYDLHVANDTEYKTELLNKLREEAEEFIENPCVEEVADILEVIDAIKTCFAYTDEEILYVKNEKHKERGGFEKRLILEKVFDRT